MSDAALLPIFVLDLAEWLNGERIRTEEFTVSALTKAPLSQQKTFHREFAQCCLGQFICARTGLAPAQLTDLGTPLSFRESLLQNLGVEVPEPLMVLFETRDGYLGNSYVVEGLMSINDAIGWGGLTNVSCSSSAPDEVQTYMQQVKDRAKKELEALGLSAIAAISAPASPIPHLTRAALLAPLFRMLGWELHFRDGETIHTFEAEA